MENQIEYHTKALKGHLKKLGGCVYKLACYDTYHVVPTVLEDDESPMSHASIQDLVGNQHAEVEAENTSFGEVGDDIFGGTLATPRDSGKNTAMEEPSTQIDENLTRVEPHTNNKARTSSRTDIEGERLGYLVPSSKYQTKAKEDNASAVEENSALTQSLQLLRPMAYFLPQGNAPRDSPQYTPEKIDCSDQIAFSEGIESSRLITSAFDEGESSTVGQVSPLFADGILSYYGGRSKEPKQQKSTEEHSLYNLARVELGEGKNQYRKPPTKPADSSLTNKGIALQKVESTVIRTDETIDSGIERVSKPTLGLDGPWDASDEFSPPDNVNEQSSAHNTIHRNLNTMSQDNCSKVLRRSTSMDFDQGYVWFSPPPPTQPLRLLKQERQIRSTQNQQQFSDNNPYKTPTDNPTFPLRTSSIPKTNHLGVANAIPVRGRRHQRERSQTSSSGQSTLSSHTEGHLSNASLGRRPFITSTRATVSSCEAEILSGSGMIGNFRPIDIPTNMAVPTTRDSNNSHLDASFKLGKVTKIPNPYEFEPDSPYYNQSPQTTFSDFMESRNGAPTSSPRVAHAKNSRSESNATYMIENLSPNPAPPSKLVGHPLKRSESSPNITPRIFQERRDRTPSPDILAYYDEVQDVVSPVRRGRSPSRASGRPTRYYPQTYNSGSYPHRHHQDSSKESHSSCDPSANPDATYRHHQGASMESHPSSHQSGTQDFLPNSAAPRRALTRSPPKTLGDVSEHDESYIPEEPQSPYLHTPKKRSRSPMKKMFGENGWLGRSPDEIPQVKLRSKKPSYPQKEKITMMGKLRIKLEEFAEKADLTPNGKGHRHGEKHPKISALSVSLSPFEQAKLCMEVEFMIVLTANSFLMNQFSQGRIAVDSIKKTVDMWRGKGRPVVIEFMYDQATQRDLVTVNQHNFRFHGERAADDVRINSMLYNWKQVASHMSLRTFCDADTVILKLLFDVEQILELLGACEGFLLKLQHTRATVNETMRVARQKRDFKPVREAALNGRSTAESSMRNPSMDDAYGGMKLVPDSYVE